MTPPNVDRPSRGGPPLNSTVVAAGILASRLSGLVREKVLAGFLGLSVWADAFSAASRLPNLVQNLLGEGTLSASFIPVYSQALLSEDRQAAGRLAGAVFALLCALAGALSLLGILGAPLLVTVFLPGFVGDRRELTISMVRLLFPMTGVLVLSAWSLGILNSHRRFFLPYAAPVIWNAAIIAALLIAGPLLALEPRDLALATAIGALVGGILQFAVQLPAVRRLEPGLQIRWDVRHADVREVIRNAIPAILGRGVVQVSGYLDLLLASLLAVGAPTALRFAQTLYMLPVSLFGMSVAAAELPELSQLSGIGSAEAVRLRTQAGLERLLFFILPSFFALLALGEPIVAALYQDGAFGAAQTRVVWLVLAGYDVGLVASTSSRLLSSAFYALHDTATPARAATARVVVSAVAGFGLMASLEAMPTLGWAGGPLRSWTSDGLPLGAAGLAAGTGLAAWMEWTWLMRVLRARIGPVGPRGPVLARNLAASALATALGLGAHLVLPPWHPIARCVVIVGLFGATWLGMGVALGLEQASGLARRLQIM